MKDNYYLNQKHLKEMHETYFAPEMGYFLKTDLKKTFILSVQSTLEARKWW